MTTAVRPDLARPAFDPPPDDNPFPSTEMVQRRTGVDICARLSTNENEFGPPAEAMAAIRDAMRDINRYPDCDHFELRAALAAEHGVEPTCLRVAAGIDGLLSSVSRVWLGAGRTLVAVDGTYPTMDYFARASGAAVHTVPYVAHRIDLDALAEEANRRGADVVYLAEPDNPTGSAAGRAAVLRLSDRLPDHTMLVVDGAYAEYQPTPRRLTVHDVLPRRLLWLRTFSKAYGLAGMRIGYAVGAPGLLRELGWGSEHYAVGRLAQVAALAALRAAGSLAAVVQATAAGLVHYRVDLAAAGLSVLPAEANFVAIRCPAGPRQAALLREWLASRGVLTRQPQASGVDDLLRVTIGPSAQRRSVLGLIVDALQSKGDEGREP